MNKNIFIYLYDTKLIKVLIKIKSNNLDDL